MLKIERLSAGYGKLVILHNINVTVEPRRFVSILGPNGSGKSTLLKTIFGLTKVYDGEILLDGESLLDVPTEAIGRRGIAYVPQRENVFTTMTVRDNLLLAVRNMGRAAAEQVLQEAFKLFPVLGERARQRAGQLSGGERQMLAIAIGWLARPKVMMLDEPSAGLSPRFVTDVFRTLKQLCLDGITMVVVEQNARSVLRWCDYVYVLREGEVAFQGTADEVTSDEEIIKGYLGVARPKRLLNAIN